jgi:hypothetical protein
MPIADTITAVPEQVLDTISATQDFIVATLTTLTEATKPLIERLPGLPLADKLPNPKPVVDNTFSSAEKLLANQRELSLMLVDASRQATRGLPWAKTAKTAKTA